MTMQRPEAARFCWFDLATAEAEVAKSFYAALFGWRTQDQKIGGGIFTQLALGETPIASLYQLNRRHLANGVPSHWTPYVAVLDIDDAAMRAESLGAQIVVKPFDVTGHARFCLIQDPAGALIGLRQQTDGNG